jgi:hypothetical protein
MIDAYPALPEAAEAYTRAYELERWWRAKRRAERAATD